MPRCLRCGCPHERENPDPNGLGLCHHHNQQLTTGTLGHHHNPRQKQHPAQQALTILNQISTPTESVRQIAARTGLTKDAVHQIRRKKWAHVRSDVWEKLQDAHADYLYNQNHGKADD